MEFLLNVQGDQQGGQRPPSTRRRQRATLANDLDKGLLNFALNKSHLQRMSRAGKVDPDEVMNAFTDFLLNFIP